jgi:hypothetical protein
LSGSLSPVTVKVRCNTQELTEQVFDALVIDGGITGVGCTLWGMSTGLSEQNGFDSVKSMITKCLASKPVIRLVADHLNFTRGS